MVLEIFGELVVGDADALLLARGGDPDEREVHLQVIQAVALVDLAVAHVDAVRHERLQALEEDGASQLVLELAAVALVAQHGFHTLTAEPPVLLELGHARDRLDQLGLAHPQPETLGFLADQHVFDQLVEGALSQVQAAHQVGRHTLEATLHRRRRPLDVAPANRLAADARNDVHPLSADRPDAPDDEEPGQEAVEDLDTGGVGVLTKEAQHSSARERG